MVHLPGLTQAGKLKLGSGEGVALPSQLILPQLFPVIL